MRWKWFVAVGVLIIVVLIAGIYVYLNTYDYNKLKPLVARMVENATGRKLSLDGEVNLEIGFAHRYMAPLLFYHSVIESKNNCFKSSALAGRGDSFVTRCWGRVPSTSLSTFSGPKPTAVRPLGMPTLRIKSTTAFESTSPASSGRAPEMSTPISLCGM